MNAESGPLKDTLALYIYPLCSYTYASKDKETSAVYDKYWKEYYERLLDI